MYFRNLYNFWEFNSIQKRIKSTHSAGLASQPKASASWLGPATKSAWPAHASRQHAERGHRVHGHRGGTGGTGPLAILGRRGRRATRRQGGGGGSLPKRWVNGEGWCPASAMVFTGAGRRTVTEAVTYDLRRTRGKVSHKEGAEGELSTALNEEGSGGGMHSRTPSATRVLRSARVDTRRG
jgi:hypothetical protein